MFLLLLPHRKGLCVCHHICVCTNCIISVPLQSFERPNIDVCSMWAMVWSGTTQEGVVGRGSVDTNAHDPRFQRVPPRNSDFYSTSQSGSSATDDYLMFDVLLDGFYLQPKRENTTKHFIIFILQGNSRLSYCPNKVVFPYFALMHLWTNCCHQCKHIPSNLPFRCLDKRQNL